MDHCTRCGFLLSSISEPDMVTKSVWQSPKKMPSCPLKVSTMEKSKRHGQCRMSIIEESYISILGHCTEWNSWGSFLSGQIVKKIFLFIISCFFVFDLTHYARWLPIHIHHFRKPSAIPSEDISHWTVSKTQNHFSAMPIDQVHE